jgi:glycosyltransferase involved in cell wall biosynthesis
LSSDESSGSPASSLVSILTPSIPERGELLRECKASVEAQTVRTFEHLVWIDTERLGCAKTMNLLAREARGVWLLPLADDDLILPGCLRVLLSHSADADIVYAPPLVTGNGDTHFFGSPPYIPSFALIRASLWHELGGYDEGRRREEDRDLWFRALAVGARFVRADAEPTWLYRFHVHPDGTPRNKSYARGVAS